MIKLDAVKSLDDMDNDDEYREENAYLLGNVEDRSTSALYIEVVYLTIMK